ncbi:MAG: hypothetical protein ACKV1O_16005 [Saprospiraceae bacterium]
MISATERIREIQNRSYNFEFGTYIERGFNIFWKQPGLFIAFTLIYLSVSGASNDLSIIVTFAANTLLLPCLMVGYFLVAHKISTGASEIQFGDFFKGFDHFRNLAIVSALSGLIVIAAAIPFLLVMFISFFWGADGLIWDSDIQHTVSRIFTEGDFIFPFWSLLLLIPSIYLSLAYSAAPFFVVFYNMEPREAMEASRKIISKRWFTIFLFSIALGFIAAMGFVVLLVGFLATFPAICCAEYAAFSDIMQLEQEGNDDDEVMRHLV